jgi:hypothetical protein
MLYYSVKIVAAGVGTTALNSDLGLRVATTSERIRKVFKRTIWPIGHSTSSAFAAVCAKVLTIA